MKTLKKKIKNVLDIADKPEERRDERCGTEPSVLMTSQPSARGPFGEQCTSDERCSSFKYFEVRQEAETSFANKFRTMEKFRRTALCLAKMQRRTSIAVFPSLWTLQGTARKSRFGFY